MPHSISVCSSVDNPTFNSHYANIHNNDYDDDNDDDDENDDDEHYLITVVLFSLRLVCKSGVFTNVIKTILKEN